MPVGMSKRVFWTFKKRIWSTAMGDPHNPSLNYTGPPFSPKLSGEYSWSFSTKLPATVSIPVKQKRRGVANATVTEREYPFPPSFTGLAYISYRMEVCVERGKFRVDSRWVALLLPVNPRNRVAFRSILVASWLGWVQTLDICPAQELDNQVTFVKWRIKSIPRSLHPTLTPTGGECSNGSEWKGRFSRLGSRVWVGK